MPVQDHMLATLVLSEAIEGGSVSELLKQAQQFAADRAATGQTYFALSGVKVDRPIEVKPGLGLIQWDDVPNCSQKERLSSAFWDTNSLHPPPLPPSCAIRLAGPRRQVLFASHDEVERSGIKMEEHFLRATEAHDLKHCLVATMNKPIGIMGSWTMLDNPIGNSISGRSFQFGDGTDWFRAAPSAPNRRLLLLLVSRFAQLKADEKNSLRIALDRLNRARRKMDQVDIAIDLGIALEAILLHHTPGTEIRFRLAVRGATFLGGLGTRKARTFEALKVAYDLRSTAVHEGTLKRRRKGNVQPIKLLMTAMPLCAQVARRVIVRGFPSDWEKGVVLADQ